MPVVGRKACIASATDENSDEGMTSTAAVPAGPESCATRIRKARHTTRDKPIAVPAGLLTYVVGRALRLCVWVVDARPHRVSQIRSSCCASDALKVALLLRQGREAHRRWGSSRIAEAVVVAEEEELVLPPRKRNQRTTQCDAVLIAVLNWL